MQINKVWRFSSRTVGIAQIVNILLKRQVVRDKKEKSIREKTKEVDEKLLEKNNFSKKSSMSHLNLS